MNMVSKLNYRPTAGPALITPRWAIGRCSRWTSGVLTVYKIDYVQLHFRWPSVCMSLKNMARPERFELPTLWFEARRSLS